MASPAVSIVALPIWATLKLSKTDLYERAQKRAQYQLIWLLPIIGASIVLAVLHQEQQAAERYGATKENKQL